ncbi:MAG: phytoene/squalene synthase family protein [Planctomycetota bacterium]
MKIREEPWDTTPELDHWDLLRRNSRTFSIAAFFLPWRCRSQVSRLYAWCRTVDDAVDLAADPVLARQELSRLQDDIHAVRMGRPATQPITNLIASMIQRREIAPSHAIDLIEGMRMDATGFCVRTEEDLLRYCYHAAGTVGLMMASVLGARDRRASKHAVSLGIAMQLTNIARDVREDASLGRCYLPAVESPSAEQQDQVELKVRRILEEAEERYAIGMAGIRFLPWQSRLAIRVAAALYREIGREILRQGCPVLQRRIVLPNHRVFWVAFSTVGTSLLMSITPDKPRESFRLNLQSLTGNAMSDSSHENAGNRRARVMEARWAVCLGLSLTSIMSGVLFVLVYINPKDESYGTIPLIYAAVSLLTAAVTNRLASRFENTAESRV